MYDDFDLIKMEEEKLGRQEDLTKDLIDMIDFSDKKYIYRITKNSDEDYIKTVDITGYIESIKKIGLLHPVYLQETDSGFFRVVSGLHRILALKKIYELNEEIDMQNNSPTAIILSMHTSDEKIYEIAFEENFRRKNASNLEFALLLHKYKNTSKATSYKNILEKFDISKSHACKLIQVLEYPTPLQNIFDEIGIKKANLINTILKYQKISEDSIYERIEELKFLSAHELEDEIKNIKSQNKKQITYRLEISKQLTEQEEEFLNKVKEILTIGNKELIEKILNIISGENYE